MHPVIITGIVIFFTHLLEGISGFGGSVMALPFLNDTIGLKTAVKLLCLFGWLMALYIVIRSWRVINWREFGHIALWVGLGMPVGMTIFDRFPVVWLCIILGFFMVTVGIHGNCKVHSPDNSNTPAKRNIWSKLILFGGGIIQGAFGSGGPLVVIYAAKALPEKSLFRVTLSLLWLTTNSCRLINWSMQGNFWTMEMGKLFLIILPFMICGLLTGDFLHRKVSAKHFKIGVYALLTVSGLVMLISNIAKAVTT